MSRRIASVVCTVMFLAGCGEEPSRVSLGRDARVVLLADHGILADQGALTDHGALADEQPGIEDDRPPPPPIDLPPASPDWALSCFPPYTEALAPPTDLSDLAAAFAPDAPVATAHEALKRRYPPGHWIVTHPLVGDGLDFWIQNQTTFDKLMLRLSTAVHEVCHKLTRKLTGQKVVYPVHSNLGLTVYDGNGLYPTNVVANYMTDAQKNASMYFSMYILGLGWQNGYWLMNELNAYIHSSLVAHAFVDYRSPTSQSSIRSGHLSFLFFLELYLKHGRLVETAQYAEMQASAEMRNTIATLWGRAALADQLSAEHPCLGTASDEAWKKLVLANKAEVEQVVCPP